MTGRGRLYLGLFPAAAILLLLATAGYWTATRTSSVGAAQGRPPRIHPDYVGVTIPPNIAPLNFCIDEPGREYRVRIHSTTGEAIEISSKAPSIRIPLSPWKALLAANKGNPLHIDVRIKADDGQWTEYPTLTNTIAEEEIDSHLVYRLMKPWYIKFGVMGIYQRNLENFEERTILETQALGRGCVNCHSFVQNAPDTMVLQFRFPFVMLLVRDGAVSAVDTRTAFNKGPFAYTSWHPSGRWAVFSVNKILQVFHTAGETRDVVDFASDLILYELDSNTATTTPAISDPERLETFPAWSPDGRHLYFCSAPALPTEDYKRSKEVRYDLMHITFDPETRTWGELDTVLRAGDTGLSIAMPRISPEGRYALFCMSDYGTFPIFYETSDLWLLDLGSGECHRLACNSDKTESWHGWSSNSRWIVFSSKRGDALFAKPHFAYIDAEGVARKPFVLPQEDPTLYDFQAKTFSVPEFITGPAPVRQRDLARAIWDTDAVRGVRLDPAVEARVSTRDEEAEWSQAPPRNGDQRKTSPSPSDAEGYAAPDAAIN